MALTPSEVDGFTPAELEEMYAGHQWRTEQRQREMLSLVWHTALLMRSKLPPLERWLDPTPKPITREEFESLKRKYDVPGE